jgi:hypothetical protein
MAAGPTAAQHSMTRQQQLQLPQAQPQAALIRQHRAVNPCLQDTERSTLCATPSRVGVLASHCASYRSKPYMQPNGCKAQAAAQQMSTVEQLHAVLHQVMLQLRWRLLTTGLACRGKQRSWTLA